MTIQTKPRFYYVDPITVSNAFITLKEPTISPAILTAQLRPGSRTMTDLMAELARALNEAGSLTYSASFNRSTRIVTITGSDTFELLIATGSFSNPFTLLGFTLTDKTGASSYTGATAMGVSYVPQFFPQNFLAFEDNLASTESAVNESASGVVEVVSFGDLRLMEMELKYITDRPKVKGHVIDNNPNAVQEARNFLTHLIRKRPVEFMKDKDDVNTFQKVIIERTNKNKDGTAFELKEMNRLNDYFETGKLVFRLL